MEDINPLDHEGLIHETLKQVRYAYGPGKLADYEDCVQTGYVALLEAAKTYDSSLGAFSSYAISRIRWAIG